MAAAIILVVGLLMVTFLPGSGAVTALRVSVFSPGILALGALIIGFSGISTGYGKRTLLIAAIALAVCIYRLGYGSQTMMEVTVPTWATPLRWTCTGENPVE